MNVEPIQNFFKRVKAATAGRSKDMRLSMEEANDLVASIGELLAAHVDEIQRPVAAPEITLSAKIDGGKF